MNAITHRIFLVGCPRSGTTLLQSLIATHPTIQSFPETHFFAYMLGRKRRYIGIPSKRAIAKLDEFLSNVEREDLKFMLNQKHYSFQKQADTFVKILDRITITQGKTAWLEKTPAHLHYIKHIQRYVPRVKFIHIVRKGEDVVASLYRVTNQYPEQWGRRNTIDDCIKRWNRDSMITKKYEDNKDHFIVTYDDITKYTGKVMKMIFTFLELDFHEKLIDNRLSHLNDLVLANEKWKSNTANSIRNCSSFNTTFDCEQQEYITNKLKSVMFNMRIVK